MLASSRFATQHMFFCLCTDSAHLAETRGNAGCLQGKSAMIGEHFSIRSGATTLQHPNSMIHHALCNNQDLHHDGHRSESKAFLARRPSFASRTMEPIFSRRRPTRESRTKSWSEPPSAATPVNLVHHASASIIIPAGTSSSTLRCTQSQQTREEAVEGKYYDCNWQRRQTHCMNCGSLFFTSRSRLSSSPSRFCSLDCKTSFEYVTRLQEVLTEQMSAASPISGSLDDSSSSEGDYELEDYQADQL
ncbi:hypothetical protein ON010_g4928 [Phytophthora cinnamomi]|nr:hypothetical protein ON010_g4928 [Phytophthora cinnamomi]